MRTFKPNFTLRDFISPDELNILDNVKDINLIRKNIHNARVSKHPKLLIISTVKIKRDFTRRSRTITHKER